MPDNIVIATKISAELDDALTQLASARGKGKATLVREALAAYVESEQDCDNAVDEERAGTRFDHVDVMREIREMLGPRR
jgi:predicted transcriptional regulator